MSKEKNPLVSVVIPLYNQRQFVAEAIDSILAQTYTPIEIIVVNDGSDDDPSPVLETYKGKIVLIDQQNLGLAGARNSGIERSKGDYLQFLDADDFLHPEKIRLQMEFMKSRKAEICYCEIAQYEQETRQSTLRYIGAREDMFAHLYNFWYPYPLPVHGVLMKRALFDRFGPFEQDLTACEDRYFFSRLAASGSDFAYFPFIGGSRRIHDANMNRERRHIIANVVKYYRKLNDCLGDDFFVERYGYTGGELMAANLTHIYRGEVARGQPRKQLRWIRRLLRENGIRFYAAPIPGAARSKRLKLPALMLKAYINRWLGKTRRRVQKD